MPRRIPWGAVLTLAGEGLSRLGLSVFLFLVAHRLGARGFGRQIISLLNDTAMLLPLADLGVHALVLRYLALNPDRNAFARLVTLKFCGSILYFAGVAIWLAASPGLHPLAWPFLLAGAYGYLNSANDFLRQSLRAREASVAEFRARLVFPLCLLLSLAMVWRGTGPAGTLFAYCLAPFGLCIAYAFALRSRGLRLRPVLDGLGIFWSRYGGFLVQAFLYLLIVGASARVEIWLIRAHADDGEVGRYGAAQNLVFAGIFFGQALAAHMYPGLQRRGREGRRLARALAAHGALALGLALGVWMVGPMVFKLVYPGADFRRGLALLPGFGALLGTSVLNYLWLTLFIGLHRQWIPAAFLVLVVAAKVALGGLWVPGMGALGMVRASLCAEIPSCLLQGLVAAWLYLRRPADDHGQIGGAVPGRDEPIGGQGQQVHGQA